MNKSRGLDILTEKQERAKQEDKFSYLKILGKFKEQIILAYFCCRALNISYVSFKYT